MRDMNAPDLTIGVIGAGAMGTGIAQVAATGGITVRMFDTRDGAAAASCESIAKRLAKRAGEGKMPQEEADAASARLQPAATLQDMADCAVVVEAIVEDLDIKQALFADLESIVAEDAILASNTSSLPIGAIAATLDKQDRIAGLHFFNPVPVMKLVEVIRGPQTTDAVMDALVALGKRLGRTPVVVKDAPGFLVNFGGRAYTTEALAILHENVATPAQIDAVMRDGFGFRMGPFELMDLTGMDVNFPVTRFVHESSFGDPRLRSTPLHRYMVETGQLGRKSGQGFFAYGEGAQVPSADTTSDAAPAAAVFVHGDAPELGALATECGANLLDADDGKAPILAAPVGEDSTAYAARNGIDHRRLVCIDMVPDTSRRVTLMTAPGADEGVRASVVSLLATQRAVTAIADSPGFIGQRISAMVANLGCEMAQIGLASPSDIDLAMRLGLNYPKGPLELADALGADVVHTILTQAQALSGDDRYRPSQWLRRRATLGLPAQQM
ncbi:3-hydroxyacyl-CoA dehydrogenase [Tepidamorphus sp. 3E244]|uniref:3-hydroxyacyl-CoA dehydrogenase n=1 Tax=Tepidamorphus sp. 3E244 TaxID=3385498 RepID=UPI0038FC9F37